VFAQYLWARAAQEAAPDITSALTPRWSRYRTRAYARLLRLYRRFCRANSLTPYPASPSTIVRYVRALRGHYGTKSIRTMLQPICATHHELGFLSPRRMPIVQSLLSAWEKEDAPRRKRAQVCTLVRLRDICSRLTGEDPLTRRDHAMFCVAFWGMMTLSEVTALDLSTCRRHGDHWVFENVGTRKRRVTLDRCNDKRICPLDTLERWLRAAGISSGKVFRQVSCWTGPSALKGLAVNTVCARWKAATAYLPAESQVSFDGLRAGMIEAAFHSGASLATLAERGGYGTNIDLLRRLRRVVTPKPNDPKLPPAGRRAPSGRRGRKRPKQRVT
jgi:hypothetical protein